MDESRESGNTDTSDKPKSKKHKKHKKSKKAAITLDEFLNMNKDVFGDGLDVQGIEEVPTQQVLKKYKGKKETVAKPISASAIAKLKKQGITVKSNSGMKSPLLKTNRNLTVNMGKAVPTHIPVKAQESPRTVAASNELLSKLLNQGNSQIKIIKKSSTENITKDKINNQNEHQETINNSLAYKALSPNTTSDTEEATEKKDNEMAQDDEMAQPQDEIKDKSPINTIENINETDKHDNTNTSTQKSVSTSVHIKPINNENDSETDQSTQTNLNTKGSTMSTEHHDTDVHMSDKDDSFENNEERTKASDDEEIADASESEPTTNLNEHCKQENVNKTRIPIMPLEALKHLSGVITVKPTQNAEEKTNLSETRSVTPDKAPEDVVENMPSKIAKILGKNIPNLTMKKSNSPQMKPDVPTKSVDTLKNINNQLTIKPSSNSKCKDESESDETDDYDAQDNIPSKNIINEDDNANFKTPASLPKQPNAIAKPSQPLDVKKQQVKNSVKESGKEEENTQKSFNIDILKRLTNVTAKPVPKVTNNVQVAKTVQSTNSPRPLIQKAEKNKQIDQDIEIFNIDDSDSDQEFPDEELCTKEFEISQKINDAKTLTSANVLKNLSKNITIKPPNSPNKNIQSPSSNDNKINIPKKQISMNINHTLKKLGNNISIKSQYSSPESHRYQLQHDDDMDDHYEMNDEESDSETPGKVKITEVEEDDKDIPSDIDMEYNENVIVQSPHASNSENEEETHSNHSEEEIDEDFDRQIKTNVLPKEKLATDCLDNFKRNNRELTIKSLNEKSADIPQVGSPSIKKEEVPRVTKNLPKNMSFKQVRETEKQDSNEVLAKHGHQTAASSSANQKVNQVNTVKTVKTFQSETIIEEITTTVTKTIRTVNQSTKQVAQNANVSNYKPRFISPNQQGKPLQGMMVRNAQTVGTKIRNATPTPRLTKATGQLVPVRPQNQIVPRQQGAFKPSAPGPSNIRKISPQASAQKPVIGKPLKISPLAMNQSMKRPFDNMPGHFTCFKKPKDSIIPPMDALADEQNDDSAVNYSSASCSRSDFSATATKTVKGKSVVTSTQARSEQHSEQHITKLNNMSGLKIVRTSSKQASQIETKNDIQSTTKRTTMDAIERLQKQGLLIKKPRIEAPEENQEYNYSDSDEDYEEK